MRLTAAEIAMEAAIKIASEVYVPSIDFACDTVLSVDLLIHTNLPDGISITNDVILLPWTREEYERMLGQAQ